MVKKGLQTPQDLALGWSVGYYGYNEARVRNNSFFWVMNKMCPMHTESNFHLIMIMK